MKGFCANVSLLFAEHPFLQRFARAREAGFRCVELHWHRDVDPCGVRAAVLDAGLEVALINFDGGDVAAGDRGVLADPARCHEFLANVPVALELAAAVGCRRLNALVGKRVEGFTHEQQLALARTNIRLAADAAAACGARVLIEALNVHDNGPCLISTTAAASELARAVQLPNVGLQFDAYHMTRMGEDLGQTLSRYGSQIEHVQLADAPGRGEPGTGTIDFDRLLDQLERIRYEGWVGLEYVPSGGDTSASLDAARRCGWLG